MPPPLVHVIVQPAGFVQRIWHLVSAPLQVRLHPLPHVTLTSAPLCAVYWQPVPHVYKHVPFVQVSRQPVVQ
jgi:hypothetical protein